MSNNILFKSLVNGVITLVIFALITSLMRGMFFLQVIMLPYYLLLAVSAAAASYIGFKLKEMKTE